MICGLIAPDTAAAGPTQTIKLGAYEGTRTDRGQVVYANNCNGGVIPIDRVAQETKPTIWMGYVFEAVRVRDGVWIPISSTFAHNHSPVYPTYEYSETWSISAAGIYRVVETIRGSGDGFVEVDAEQVFDLNTGVLTATRHIRWASPPGFCSSVEDVTIVTKGTYTLLPEDVPPCKYSLFVTATSFPAAGGAGTLHGNANCPWSIQADGLTFPSYSSGLGGFAAPFTVPPNTGKPRTFTAILYEGLTTIRGEGASAITISQDGSPTAPEVTAHPVSLLVKASTVVQFSAAASGSPAPTVQWQSAAANSSAFVNIAGATNGSYSQLVTDADHGRRFRAVFTNSEGIATTAAALLAVRGAVLVTPASLKFAASKLVDGPVLAVTSAQVVTVDFKAASSDWTATTSAPWLSITGGTGTSAGQFSVSVVRNELPIGTSSSLAATIAITAPTAPNSPISIPVTLTVTHHTPAANPPFGRVETPLQNASGIVGAIGVTGWAMDDIGVTSVKIYRNCLSFEALATCGPGTANVVYIGDAAFLSGARPDVERAFPNHPQAYRAGWGYLMMTSMLPHVTAQQPYGGQGPLTLYVFATDVEGNVTLLGRSEVDHTPTSITMANDSIAKPFGAIDTPGQGQTVSGIVHNFGWALTPDSDTVAGNSDILIPTSGSTMFVFIDGAPVAPIAYNQCRGNVGNPVPSGVFCNDDVANIFGRTTPQAALTARTSNPTRHRNLDAGNAAIGVYSIDTTKLSNGLHTIAWSVTDSAGRTEGIGSRFFNVLNSSSDAAAAAQEIQQRAPVVHGRSAGADNASPVAGPDATIRVRRGFDLQATFEPTAPAEGGIYRVALPELDRLELKLPSADRAHLLVNDQLRDLPAGASFAPGTFAWAPPAGYIGTYDLVFSGGGQRLTVRVTIRPR